MAAEAERVQAVQLERDAEAERAASQNSENTALQVRRRGLRGTAWPRRSLSAGPLYQNDASLGASL